MLRGLLKHLKPLSHRHPIDKLAEANGLLGGFVLYPQLFQLFFSKDVSSLAPTTFLLITVSNIIWLIYGLHRRTPPIIISAIFSALAGISILALIIAWR